jgi:hypothetical protein
MWNFEVEVSEIKVYNFCNSAREPCNDLPWTKQDFIQVFTTLNVRYHSGGSMKLNACILHLAHMVYL